MTDVKGRLERQYHKALHDCTDKEIYFGLLDMVKELAGQKEGGPEDIGCNKGKKKIYYISAEFLIGKLLVNNLMNLGVYQEVKDVLAENGKDLSVIEGLEPEPSLGNGGLGRLAACYLDSMATLGLNGDGVGLRYHFGLFRQAFYKNFQIENKDPWLEDHNWLIWTDTVYPVYFGGFTVYARMYDLQVTGYDSNTNRLHLFDIDTIDEGLVGEGIQFDKTDIMKCLTLFLYPDDSDDAGRLLRVYQEYFLSSSAAQLILAESERKGCDLHDLADHAAIQINDTHPSMIIPELIRLLMEKGIRMGKAIEIVTKTCAYTNHTILEEALEKIPMDHLRKVAPQLLPIIRELDTMVKEKYAGRGVDIFDEWGTVRMAYMDIHYGHSVNGVAHLHTEILKNNALNKFYQIYPEKFNNKTNGITFRRWLMHCNPGLTAYINKLIGTGWHKDATKLEKLMKYVDDEKVLLNILKIKHENKVALADWLNKAYHVAAIDPKSIFDIQVKRLHEYKRQQMNALFVIHKYLQIKKGNLPTTPITVIFGAKAAPAYVIAKDIIHLILCLQQVIDADPEVSPHLKVVMIKNYNVTVAEKLAPACEISEQISLASKEASGTGNMKFMLNGGVTLGTMDGANVEIAQLVGPDNIYIFGESSDQVIAHYANNDYVSKNYYDNDADIREAMDFIHGETLLSVGDRTCLDRLFYELLNKDWFMTLLDFKSYAEKREEIFKAYEEPMAWAKKMLINTAKAGFFSSDRAIEEYNRDIWHA